MFNEVFIKLGGKIAPIITACLVDWQHPEWQRLNTNNIRNSSTTNSDYTITGLNRIHEIPERELYKESLVLWNTVVNDKNLRHHEARFAANSSRPVEVFDSRVAYVLKRVKWIPNKDGVFCRPCEITAEELPDEFVYNENAGFLHNLGFGDENQAPNDIAAILEKAGVSVSAVDEELLRLPDDVKAELLRLHKERKESEQKRLSLSEAIAGESKTQSDFDEDDDYDRDISVKNPSARAKRQQEDFEAGLEKKVTVKPVLTYTYSTKTSGFEKQFVKEQYRGRCQICDRDPIRKHNGDIYFEAINIISTAHLDTSLLNDISKGWNTLCLCPTCAAEYRYCSKNLDGFEEQVENTTIEAGRNEHIPIQIELKGKPIQIKFTPKHFIALKSAFKVYKEHENN